MNMKRRIMSLALAIIMCIALTPSAFAASIYKLTLTISSDNAADGTVSYEARYIAGNTSLSAQVVAGINLRKNDGSLREAFKSPAMREEMQKGIDAYNATKADSTNTAWGDYVAAVDAKVTASDGSIKTNLKDMSKTFADQGEGTYTLRFKNEVAGDDKVNTTYTVTIVLAEDTYGGGGGGSSTVEKTATVTIREAEGGSATASKTKVTVGDTVKVTLKPDAGYAISRIEVMDANGSYMDTTYTGNGVYTFTVPEGGATVTPVFKKKIANPEETGVAEMLITENHIVYMEGYEDGEFRPNNNITRAEVAQIFYRLLKNRSVEITKGFEDVADDAWYAEAVRTLASLEIINGVSDTRFEPARAITRAEFTAICTRFAKEAAGTVSFPDVPEDHWAYKNIATASEYGWIVGDENGNFNPNDNITRTEAATIVNRMLERLGDFKAINGGAAKKFADVSNSFWGYYEIAEATSGHAHDYDKENVHETWK